MIIWFCAWSKTCYGALKLHEFFGSPLCIFSFDSTSHKSESLDTQLIYKRELCSGSGQKNSCRWTHSIVVKLLQQSIFYGRYADALRGVNAYESSSYTLAVEFSDMRLPVAYSKTSIFHHETIRRCFFSIVINISG